MSRNEIIRNLKEIASEMRLHDDNDRKNYSKMLETVKHLDKLFDSFDDALKEMRHNKIGL